MKKSTGLIHSDIAFHPGLNIHTTFSNMSCRKVFYDTIFPNNVLLWLATKPPADNEAASHPPLDTSYSHPLMEGAFFLCHVTPALSCLRLSNLWQNTLSYVIIHVTHRSGVWSKIKPGFILRKFLKCHESGICLTV